MSDRYRRPRVVLTGDIRDTTHGPGGNESDLDAGNFYDAAYGDDGDDGDDGDGDS
jgi:hypothetical protein